MTRRQLLRWAGWFVAANAGLCFAIGLRAPLADHQLGCVLGRA